LERVSQVSTTYPLLSATTPRRERRSNNEPCLVEMQVSGDRPPLFWAHGISGSTGLFRPVARLLASRRDVYGLENHAATTSAPLEELARRYAAAINACRPDGPCEVVGYSLGGLVALETARQLARSGREVALTGILDTAPPTVPVAPENTSVALSMISYILGLKPPFDPQTVGTDSELISLLSLRAVEARVLPSSLAFDYVSAMVRTWTWNGQAADSYRAPAYHGPTAILFTRNGDAIRHRELWRTFAPGTVRTKIVDLDHMTLIRDASSLHAVIDEWLTR
jgi:thioesterase domain-containing protein